MAGRRAVVEKFTAPFAHQALKHRAGDVSHIDLLIRCPMRRQAESFLSRDLAAGSPLDAAREAAANRRAARENHLGVLRLGVLGRLDDDDTAVAEPGMTHIIVAVH